MNHKRGLSSIVITLILIAVSLAVVGIVWFVISNVLNSTSDDINQRTSALFQTCVEAGLLKMNKTDICSNGTIAYIGGEKCCNDGSVSLGSSCVDNDGDSYGSGCTLGGDCNDNS